MKARDAIKRLKADGWVMVRKNGSHRTFAHKDHRDIITISKQDGDDLTPGELRSTERIAGWR